MEMASANWHWQELQIDLMDLCRFCVAANSPSYGVCLKSFALALLDSLTRLRRGLRDLLLWLRVQGSLVLDVRNSDLQSGLLDSGGSGIRC